MNEGPDDYESVLPPRDSEWSDSERGKKVEKANEAVRGRSE